MFLVVIWLFSVICCLYASYLLLNKTSGRSFYEKETRKIKFPLLVHLLLYIISFVPLVNLGIFCLFILVKGEFEDVNIDSILFKEY